jgi:hypothetical protein
MGDPNQPGSNTFIPNARPNGISSWTPGVVQPAGQVNELPGVRFGNVAQEHVRQGADPELVAGTITATANEVDDAIIKVAGSHGVLPEVVSGLKQGGSQALEDYTILLNQGEDPKAARIAKVLPFLKVAGETLAGNRYRKPPEKVVYDIQSESFPAQEGVPGTPEIPAEKKSLFGFDWLAKDQPFVPAVPAIPGHGAIRTSRKIPMAGSAQSPLETKKPLTKAKAEEFKTRAGGNRAKAEAMALAEGYEF